MLSFSYSSYRSYSKTKPTYIQEQKHSRFSTGPTGTITKRKRRVNTRTKTKTVFSYLYSIHPYNPITKPTPQLGYLIYNSVGTHILCNIHYVMNFIIYKIPQRPSCFHVVLILYIHLNSNIIQYQIINQSIHPLSPEVITSFNHPLFVTTSVIIYNAKYCIRNHIPIDFQRKTIHQLCQLFVAPITPNDLLLVKGRRGRKIYIEYIVGCIDYSVSIIPQETLVLAL